MADFKLSANIEVRKQAPLDDRLTKIKKTDLIKPESWASDNGTYYVYPYMVVGTQDGLFMLMDVNKLLDADYSGWKRVGSESTSTGGLTEDQVRDLLDMILSDYVQKEEGKGLSTNDYTNEDKTKLNELNNYDDTTIKTQIQGLQNSLNTLVGGNASSAIESFNEIMAFLASIEDTQTLGGIINGINQAIAAVEAKIPTKTSELTNDSGFITSEAIPDLNEYAKKSDIPTDYLKTIPEEYITESELEDRLKALTPEGGISETRVQQLIDVEKQRAQEVEQELSENILNVENKIPTNISQLSNDSGYITLNEVVHPDLSEYAKKSDIPTDYIKQIPSEYITETELEDRLAIFIPGTGGEGGITDAQVQALQAAIKAEADRAKGVEELLTQRITEETANSNAAYTSIDNKFTQMVGDEETRATQAEGELSERIDEVDGNIPTKTSQLENDSNFLTEHQSLEHLATKEELTTKQDVIEDLNAIREGSQRSIPTKVSELENDSNFITEQQSLENLATKEELATKQDIIDDLEVIRENSQRVIPTKVSELENDKGYLTEHQDISHLVTSDDISEMTNDIAQAKANSEAALTQSNQAKVNADTAFTQSNVAIESIKSLQGLSNADEAMVELAKQITQIAQNTSDIQLLRDRHQPPMTEEQFQAIEDAGELKEDTFYYIYEE